MTTKPTNKELAACLPLAGLLGHGWTRAVANAADELPGVPKRGSEDRDAFEMKAIIDGKLDVWEAWERRCAIPDPLGPGIAPESSGSTGSGRLSWEVREDDDGTLRAQVVVWRPAPRCDECRIFSGIPVLSIHGTPGQQVDDDDLGILTGEHPEWCLPRRRHRLTLEYAADALDLRLSDEQRNRLRESCLPDDDMEMWDM